MDGADRESPETRRVAMKKTSRGQPGFVTDTIATIEEDERDSPVKKKGWDEERESMKPAIPKPKPPPPRKEAPSYDEDRPSTLLHSKSTKDEQVLTLSRNSDKSPSNLKSDGLGLDESLGRLAPTGMGGRPQPPGGNKSGFKAAPTDKYDLDLSDDEDEKKVFDMERCE
jgi:hypothetical protein